MTEDQAALVGLSAPGPYSQCIMCVCIVAAQYTGTSVYTQVLVF